ncbi:MAG: DCC1-like thiol-disulfide oxidoreductase family protein [Vulcanimicrobiota bacterium]
MSSRLPVGYRFYWDDHCKLCNALKRLGVALDWSKRVTFLSLLDEAADIDLGHLTFEERMASSHLVDPDSRVYSRGQGILKLASLLPLTAPLVFLFRLLPQSDSLAEKLYGLVSRNRGVPYGGSCQVEFPDPEA